MIFELIISRIRSAILFSIALIPFLNAQSWQRVNEVDSADVLSVIEHNNLLVASTLNKIYLSYDAGDSWQAVPSLPGVTSDFNILFSYQSYLYLGTNGDGVYRTSNNGLEWNSFSTGLSGFSKSITSFTSLGDSLYIGTGGSGIYLINLQNPVSWIPINNGLVNFGVTAIAVSGNFLVAGSGLYLYVKHRSVSEWQSVFVDTAQLQRTFFTFEIFNGYLFAGTDNGIYRGSLDAQSWERTDITFFPGKDIVSMVTLGNELLVGLLYQGQHWMFSTDDNGLNWETKAHEFAYLWDMLVHDDKLFAGRSDGLWYYDITNWTEVDENTPDKLNDFSLKQNYPNPFNPGTIISWQSPVNSCQTIKLFNAIGQEVETLVDGYYETGVHSKLYVVNSSLPSGVYYYQLKAGDFIETKKMILIK